MKKSNSTDGILPVLIILAAILCAPYLINAYKLAGCDFKSDYKCEAIHLAGVVIPPASWITVWFSSDRGEK